MSKPLGGKKKEQKLKPVRKLEDFLNAVIWRFEFHSVFINYIFYLSTVLLLFFITSAKEVKPPAGVI